MYNTFGFTVATRESRFLHGYRSFACGIACPDGLSPRMSKLRATRGNLRAISHNPIYIRAAHAIRILGIECPWGRTGATGTYETLPRAMASRFFSSLPLAVIASCGAGPSFFCTGPSREVKEMRSALHITAVTLTSMWPTCKCSENKAPRGRPF